MHACSSDVGLPGHAASVHSQPQQCPAALARCDPSLFAPPAKATWLTGPFPFCYLIASVRACRADARLPCRRPLSHGRQYGVAARQAAQATGGGGCRCGRGSYWDQVERRRRRRRGVRRARAGQGQRRERRRQRRRTGRRREAVRRRPVQRRRRRPVIINIAADYIRRIGETNGARVVVWKELQRMRRLVRSSLPNPTAASLTDCSSSLAQVMCNCVLFRACSRRRGRGSCADGIGYT